MKQIISIVLLKLSARMIREAESSTHDELEIPIGRLSEIAYLIAVDLFLCYATPYFSG